MAQALLPLRNAECVSPNFCTVEAADTELGLGMLLPSQCFTLQMSVLEGFVYFPYPSERISSGSASCVHACLCSEISVLLQVTDHCLLGQANALWLTLHTVTAISFKHETGLYLVEYFLTHLIML